MPTLCNRASAKYGNFLDLCTKHIGKWHFVLVISILGSKSVSVWALILVNITVICIDLNNSNKKTISAKTKYMPPAK